MVSQMRRLAEAKFENLCEHLAVAVAHCTDQQMLDLADSLHAALRRRRKDTRPARSSGWNAKTRIHAIVVPHIAKTVEGEIPLLARSSGVSWALEAAP